MKHFYFILLLLLVSCGSEESNGEYPYYKVEQSYDVGNNNGKESFSITTTVVKYLKDYDYDYERDNATKVLWGRTISGIEYKRIDSCLISEYDVAFSQIEKYEHLDQIINKDYKK